MKISWVRFGFEPQKMRFFASRWKSQLKRIAVFALLIGATAGSTPVGARQFPPVVPPPQAVTLPAPAERVLSNGLEVVVLERHNLPLLTMDFAIRTGSEADPAHLPGAAQFVAEMLDEGTKTRGAMQIAAAIDDAGGTIDTGAEWDDSYITITVLSGNAEPALDLLSDMVMHPAFDPAEVERIRKQTLSALDVLRQDPEYIADTVFEGVEFEGTPYGHPADGVAESVQRLTPGDLQRFYARYYQPSNAVLVMAGDTTAPAAFALARKYFGSWQGREAAPPVQPALATPQPASAPPPPARARVVAIDDPNAVQTVIRVGNRAINRAGADFAALTVANEVLGGPAENLLFSALRSQRGLVYGASSELDCYRRTGGWEEKTSTRTDQTVRAVRVVLDQMRHLRAHALGTWDVENAKNYLIGHMALNFETSEDIAARFAELPVYHLPLDYWSQFPQQIQSVTLSQARDATRRYLNPESASIVLVGNLKNVKSGLKQFGDVRMIPLSSLNFTDLKN
jgi:zinc protease